MRGSVGPAHAINQRIRCPGNRSLLAVAGNVRRSVATSLGRQCHVWRMAGSKFDGLTGSLMNLEGSDDKWLDCRPQGKTGKAVVDLYTPEIAASKSGYNTLDPASIMRYDMTHTNVRPCFCLSCCI